MKKIFYLVFWLVMILPIKSFAQSGGPGGGTGGSGGGNDIAITNPLAVETIPGILDRIINFMIVLAGPIAVLMLVYAGYLFVIGSTNENNIKTARKIILYTVIGIAILMLSKSIIYVSCDVLGSDCRGSAPVPANPTETPSG